MCQEVDPSRSSNRLRLVEYARRIFIVQVRGGLNDCALPALQINHERHELSVDWKWLFGRFFARKKMIRTELEDALVSLENELDV